MLILWVLLVPTAVIYNILFGEKKNHLFFDHLEITTINHFLRTKFSTSVSCLKIGREKLLAIMQLKS